MLQRWQAVDNVVSDLTEPRFEPQTSRSRDGHQLADDFLELDQNFFETSLNTQKQILTVKDYYSLITIEIKIS